MKRAGSGILPMIAVDRAAAPAAIAGVDVLDLARRVGRDLDVVRVVGGEEGGRPVDPRPVHAAGGQQAEGPNDRYSLLVKGMDATISRTPEVRNCITRVTSVQSVKSR